VRIASPDPACAYRHIASRGAVSDPPGRMTEVTPAYYGLAWRQRGAGLFSIVFERNVRPVAAGVFSFVSLRRAVLPAAAKKAGSQRHIATGFSIRIWTSILAVVVYSSHATIVSFARLASPYCGDPNHNFCLRYDSATGSR